jgi:hypothetical protein
VIERPFTEHRISLFAFVLALLLAWVCYSPALSGSFQLDDVSNLGGLSRVSDLDSGLRFTLSGEAGPLGRPIALATFAWQAESWAQGAAAFLRTNLLIHLLNAALLAFCVFRLSLCLSIDRGRATTNAVVVASIWVLLPLLATSSLLVVQRMTTLSATFMLAGLAAYLLARSRLNDAPRRALLWMGVSLTIGTTLAMLCKESGVLLPVYVLVLEATVLERPGNVEKRIWRIWQCVFLAAPLLIIVAYLAMKSSYPEALVLRRGFTAGERLMTEARLLWAYLFKAIIGRPDTLGIFQDPPSVARSLLQPATFLACISWIVLAITAIVWRRRYPLIALAVLWYLAGHLIESTHLALELYFEHRNYLPIIGPVLALGIFICRAGQRGVRVGLAAVTVFVAVNAYFLFVFASLWGEPSLASRHWAMRYPDSVRAVTTMATFQLLEEGPQRTIHTLDDFATRNPQHAYLRIQQLNLLCRFSESADHEKVVAQLHRELPSVTFTYTAGTMLSQLLDAAVAIDCSALSTETVSALASSLRNNPLYVGDPAYNQFSEKLQAGIARYEGDHVASLEHLQAAIAYGPTSELNMMMVSTLSDVGEFDAARKFIDDVRVAAPWNPLQAASWHKNLDELAIYIDELEKVWQ